MMAAKRWLHLEGGVLPPVPPYGSWDDYGRLLDVVPSITVRCFECGWSLWEGWTEDGAPVLMCPPCRLIVDERRVA